MKFVVIGDLMLDVALSGTVERICPEAPVPVVAVEAEEYHLGGAANVSNNLAPFAGEVVTMGVVGDDEAGERLRALLASIGGRAAFAVEPDRPTTTKTRLLAAHQQLMRYDRETRRPIARETAERLLAGLDRELEGAAAVFAPDYAKGCLTRELFAAVAARCRERGLPLFVDPKLADITHYSGATLIKPNRGECAASAGVAIPGPDEALRAAEKLLEAARADAILVTLGAQGMVLRERGGAPGGTHIPTESREVFDVTGAGDTTLAFVGLGVAGGLALADAAALANVAAGITISKRGTARVEHFELVAALTLRERRTTASHKVVPRADVRPLGESLRRRGRRIVLTNGCFDLYHPGHAELLRAARALGDVLVVGINSDDSVRRLKGPNRPFLTESGRLTILSDHSCVDHVVVFEEDTPDALIADLRPDVLAKGANYSVDEVVGGEAVRAYGGDVQVLPMAPGHSITELSRQIHDRIASSEHVAPAARTTSGS